MSIYLDSLSTAEYVAFVEEGILEDVITAEFVKSFETLADAFDDAVKIAAVLGEDVDAVEYAFAAIGAYAIVDGYYVDSAGYAIVAA